jgi:ribosomal protein S18 acetylase RimI-like enzyme
VLQVSWPLPVKIATYFWEGEIITITMSREQEDGPKAERLSIRVREMEIDDLARVYHLGERLFKARKAPNMYRTWDEYEIIELFHGDSEFCFVAEVEDQPVGFALGTTISKSHSAWKYGHLVWLGVEPTFQRKGVAEKLFSRFRDVMKKNGVRMLIVDTEADNLPALYFFRKLGFGSPQPHIYLTMNLTAKPISSQKKVNNGLSRPGNRRRNGKH